MFESARYIPAQAQTADVSAKEAFDAARVLGTKQAWEAFLANYPTGFYGDLARAYVKKLAEGDASPSVTPAQNTSPVELPTSKPAAAVPAVTVAPAPIPLSVVRAAAPAAGVPDNLAATNPQQPAVARGAAYMGFPERFNRYYTDPSWRASRTLFVSPNGNGSGASREAPMSVRAGLDSAGPGTRINFLRGKYQALFRTHEGA